MSKLKMPVGSGLDGNVDWASVPDCQIPTRAIVSERVQERRARRGRSFVKGPLPMGWIGAAARCGNAKGLAVLLALKAKADTTRTTWVKPPAAVLEELLGVERMTRSRAIAALERARLLEVRRRRGRPPLVRLLPWEEGKEGEEKEDG